MSQGCPYFIISNISSTEAWAVLVEKEEPVIDIGERNIQVARRILNMHRIRIIRQDVGGESGRCIRFNTATNTVFRQFTDLAEQNQQL